MVSLTIPSFVQYAGFTILGVEELGGARVAEFYGGTGEAHLAKFSFRLSTNWSTSCWAFSRV
jgi:hypothetical protein